MNERPPTVHTLKCWLSYLEEMISGRKTFEVRQRDRDYRVGDHLRLLGYDPERKEHNGREMNVVVTYILDGGAFGIDRDYCVMATKPWRIDDP
jgi:ParB family chromosome partitioning protein